MYWEYYIMGIILLPAIIFSSIVQAKVLLTFKKYNQVASQNCLTAKQVAEKMLQKYGADDVVIKQIGGNLTDYYSDKDKTLALSESVCNSNSVSAIGVAMHEVGHAIQYAEGYALIKVRNFMVKVCNLSSKLLWPLVVIGLLLNLGVDNGGILGSICLWSGIGFFSLSILFNLITLPVEYDASNRAKKIMAQENILTNEELSQASKVLNSAALTYVATLMVSVLNLLRFLLVVLGSKKRK